MEILYNNYLINYNSNINDFRINIYNKLNNKKYELIELALVSKYKEIGIDLIKIITNCLQNISKTTKNISIDENETIKYEFNEDETIENEFSENETNEDEFSENETNKDKTNDNISNKDDFVQIKTTNETKFDLIDNDKFIITKFDYKQTVIFQLMIPNILCEYKDASILDLKTDLLQFNKIIKNHEEKIHDLQLLNKIIKNHKEEILDLQLKNEELTNKLTKSLTKIDLGNHVRIPKEIKHLVICNIIMDTNYPTQIPLSINCYAYHNNSYHLSVSQIFPKHYYGRKKNFSLQYLQPSPNEFYQNPETPFICFKDEIDCEMLKDIKLTKLGLYNIKIKNISKLTKIAKLYLTNVEFLDDEVFSNKLEIQELGLENCNNISNIMLEMIKKIHKSNTLKKIYIKDSNIKKTDLPTSLEIINT